MDEYKVIFKIVDCNENITDLLGIKPDEIKVKGDNIASGNPPRPLKILNKHNTWELHSITGVEETASLESHVNYMITRLSSVEDNLKIITASYYTELAVIAYFRSSNFGYHIEPKVVQKLSNWNIAVDFDLYYVGENHH